MHGQVDGTSAAAGLVPVEELGAGERWRSPKMNHLRSFRLSHPKGLSFSKQFRLNK